MNSIEDTNEASDLIGLSIRIVRIQFVLRDPPDS